MTGLIAVTLRICLWKERTGCEDYLLEGDSNKQVDNKEDGYIKRDRMERKEKKNRQTRVEKQGRGSRNLYSRGTHGCNEDGCESLDKTRLAK